MSRFQKAFDTLAGAGKTALMPYVTAGDPTLSWTERLVDRLIRSGADMIELGVPYSDPLADGPTVQAAGQRALSSGTTVQGVFDLVRRIRAQHDTPIAILVYYNCIYRWGEERFVKEAQACGIDAFVVPDLPPEEAESLQSLMQAHDLDLAYLLAPTSTEDRIQLVTGRASGFIYCVSLTGVTGARSELSKQLAPFITRVREGLAAHRKSVPLVVGFGISSAAHVKAVSDLAEGVIVGSALIDTMHKAASPEEGVGACGALIAEMRGALDAALQVGGGHAR